ncbi:MAG: sdhB [Firmicutes bacterium]|nr:sdhB [Bacillota bacterium]
MRGVFDIIGPIMIGPSSSHTAGAVRIGLMARKILGEEPVQATIELYGSFAQTYKGHGTDKAIIAGIMGFATDDERIKDALSIAVSKGLEYQINTTDLGDAHPNTAVIYLIGEAGRMTKVVGASIGGGNIRITNIDEYDVELTGQYHTLISIHNDRPGVITKVTSVLAKYKINVAFMRVSRKSRGAEALMIIEVDEPIPDDVLEETKQVHGVTNSFRIPPI